MALRDAKKLKVLGPELDRLLEAVEDDRALLTQLEGLGREPAFGLLADRWGPTLYARNRVLFRPFILSHLSFWGYDGRRWRRLSWKKSGDRLQPWMEAADRADDVPIFRALYQLQLSDEPKGERTWRARLLERLTAASRPAERAMVLEKLNLGFRVDEATALEVYRLAPESGPEFILYHLPWFGGYRGRGKRTPWRTLWAAARDQRDDDFYFSLYRQQVPAKEWREDILRLAAEITDAERLDLALERRHPQGLHAALADGMAALAEKRGEAVHPYLHRHLQEVYTYGWGERKGYRRLRDLAVARGWTRLWGALIRICAQASEYDEEVRGVLLDSSLSDAETIRKLSLLAGSSRELNFGPIGLARVRPLSDENAVKLYESYPRLLRGPFKVNASPGWRSTYPKLTRAAWEAEDEGLLDFLASRIVTRIWGIEREVARQIDDLTEYYSDLFSHETEGARRAAHVLGLVPAYAIGNYNALIRNNKLARLLYERSASRYLGVPDALFDLLEASEIHAQALAFRALGQDDPRAIAAAHDRLEHLLATLLRPLHRKTRILAFRALANAAVDPDSARRIVSKAKEAMALPEARYPKDALVALIGSLLHRYPDARDEAEQPVVYRRGAA